MTKKYQNLPGETGSPYDPLNVAKAEGKLLGWGLSGKYRKTKLNRSGFFVLGLFISCLGALSVSALWMILQENTNLEEKATGMVLGFVGALCLILGIIMLKKAID